MKPAKKYSRPSVCWARPGPDGSAGLSFSRIRRTKAHEISLDGGFIDNEKMNSLKNFTDESCLEFGAEHNLLLKKIGRIMPWFVNAYSDLPVADFYRQKIDEILKMDESEWNRIAPGFGEQDKNYSQHFSEKGLSHYAIKYNPFMGVISDYFLNEKS